MYVHMYGELYTQLLDNDHYGPIMDQVTRKRISEMSTSFDDFNFSSLSEEVGLSTSEIAALLGGAMLSTPDAD